jgi:hypothetical protein
MQNAREQGGLLLSAKLSLTGFEPTLANPGAGYR